MNAFRTALSILTVAAALLLGAAEVADDFTRPEMWKIQKGTVGTIEPVKPAGLTLTNAPGGPGWCTMTRTFEVDLDENPEFTLQVKAAAGGGEVKLYNRGTREKHSILKFRRPGTYRVNLAKQFNWKGKAQIDVALYVVSKEKAITFEALRFGPESANPEPEPGLVTKPLFSSCGYYWKGPKQELGVTFRRKGGEWRNALPPVYVEADGGYRGSLVLLDEDSEYELAVADAAGKPLASGTFRTWSSAVPVARTVVLNAENFPGTLKISEHGRPDGWIRYTAAPGFVLANDHSAPLVELDGAAYILLEGMTLKGGEKNAIAIRDCDNVRVINCDLSGWGRPGTQRFDKDGKFYDGAGKAINYDGGILISRSRGTVVERCYIHDARTTANAWHYSHPAGPEGILVDSPTSTVIRYNDIVGSDGHRWNDAIEGTGNFNPDGGFNRDADICGNYLAFSNDDSIELDGGQQNVRCFFNRFEGWYCGVSIQGCMEGPSYVFDNLLLRGGDRFGAAGQGIKTSSPRSGPQAVSYLFNNTIDGAGKGVSMLPHLKIVAFNNLFTGSNSIFRRARSPQSEADYNLLPFSNEPAGAHDIVAPARLTAPERGVFTPAPGSPAIAAGRAIDNFTAKEKVDVGAFQTATPRALPYRPLPVEVDAGVLDFGDLPGAAEKRLGFTATVAPGDFSSAFTVRQNDDADWFEVAPASGTLRGGDKMEFQVTLKPEKMHGRRFFRAALLLRFADGLSRPVSVYAENLNPDAAIRPLPAGPDTVYIDAASPASGKRYATTPDPLADGGKAVRLEGEAGKNPAVYEFELEKDGDYFLLFRLRGEVPPEAHDSLFCGVNADEPAETHLNGKSFWSWSVGAPGKGQFQRLRVYALKKGKNIIRIAPRESLSLDLIAVTRDPGAFETR